jgi:hypothetical protein
MKPEADLKLYPAWRQVERDLLASGLPDGSTVPMEYLRASLGLRDPKTLNGDEALREQAHFNFAMGELKESLLTNHRISLRLVPAVGYMVTPPEDQTRMAMKDHGAEVMNALLRAEQKVTHVRAEQLTNEQRRENADALAKLSSLRALNRKRLG